jgi:hypothetical protein
MATQIQLRRDTAANWTSTNPTMAQGEAGYETDTGKLKVGDGTTAWNSLAYQAAANIVDGTIVNADINASAAIADTKLATISTGGKVANSATTATELLAAGAIVARDSSGNFTAGTITASLTGAASLNVLKAGDTMTGALSVPLGSASAPSIYPGTDTNTGIYSPGADQVAISTNGSERLRILSDGKVGLGTSSPGSRLTVNRVNFADASATGSTTLSNAGITVEATTDTNSRLMFGIGSTGSSPWIQAQNTSSNATQSLILNPVGGNVGIGTTSPGQKLVLQETVSGTAVYTQYFNSGSLLIGYVGLNTSGNMTVQTNDQLLFQTGPSYLERARIDSSGRLLVGTSSARAIVQNAAESKVQIEAVDGSASLQVINNASSAAGPVLFLGKSRGGSLGSNTVVQSGDTLGSIQFAGADGSDLDSGAATISCAVDGTPGTNDMPGRLVFSTTADGASSPTERMRITNAGRIGINVTGPTFLLELPNTATDAGGRGRANQWATYSDGRIKTDREDLPYGIDAVMQLEPLRYFHHNSTINEDGTIEILEEGEVSIGLVAQDVDNIIPEVVSVPEDLTKDLCSLDYAKLNAVLVKAIQEQQAMIAELQTKVAALEAQ